MSTKINFRHLLNVFSFLLAFTLWSCDKDEGGSVKPQQSIDAYRYQAVTIDVANVELKQNGYEATFGANTVKVMKIDDNKLGFFIPANANLGTTLLTISSLNTTISYNVLQPVLPQTPDETIAQFTTLGDAFIASQTETDPENNYEKFKDFYANNATAEQKEQIALFYYANKQAIDNLIQFDPENPNGRFSTSDAVLIGKFMLAVGAGGASAWIAYSQVIADPAGAILGAAAAYFFYTKAKFYGTRIVNIANITTTGLSLGGLSGTNGRSIKSIIKLTDGTAVSLPFQLQGRALTLSDANTTHETVSGFFGKLNYMNDFITKTNAAIEWINVKVPLVNFSTFELIALQTSPATVSTNVSGEAMQDISFSINHPDLQLVNASLANDGQLNLKVKITGNPAETTVVSTLNYTFSDGLSNFSGYFDIECAVEQFELEYISGNGQTYGGGGMPYPLVFKIKNLNLNSYVTNLNDKDLTLSAVANTGNLEDPFTNSSNYCGNNDPGCFGAYYYISSNQGNPPFILTITVMLKRNNVEIDSYIIQQKITS